VINSSIILYGQIIDLPQSDELMQKELKDLKSRYKSAFNSLSEKYGNEVFYNNSEIISLDFRLPENAIHFAINTFHFFIQGPRIPFKAGISFASKEKGQTRLKLNNSLAYKLSEVCPEGAILLTSNVVGLLKEYKEFEFAYIGSLLLKGIKSPVEVYALSLKGFYVPSQDELIPKQKKKNSIAVLPFHNTSSEKELDYICDGIAEEVIDSLSKSKDLFVTARSSSFIFKNKELSILDISRKLNVNYVLDGSIRKRTNEYRISYQLVDSLSGYNIISDTISSEFETLYDSENQISKSILQHFNQNKPEHELKDEKDFYIDPEAYSHYLHGKYFLKKWDSDTSCAISQFNKALEIVPNYALAYAGISMCYAYMALNRVGDFKENITNALINAEKSIEADKTLPDGYVAKALASFWVGNWFVPDFEKNITTALAISPCNAEIRMYNGMAFLIKGELKRALSEMKLAKELDPFSSSVNIRLGLIQYLNREYEAAHNTYLVLLNEDVNRTYNVLRLACCCIMLKQYHQALDYLNMGDDTYEYQNMKYGLYLEVYKGLKDEDSFFSTRSIIEQLPENETSTYYNKAILYKLLGKHEQSIQYLEKMLHNPLFYLMFLQYDEYWSAYHKHPLFLELIVSKYKGKGNQVIKIESDTKEFIELIISDFLYAEAQDNYTLIVFKQNKKKNEKILRTTLANVEKQLKYQDIVRCHRSYIINSSSGYTYHKSGNKAFLKNNELDITIPVSRSKEKEVKKWISC
jgi:TolB-like protein/Tfp pilus assembly protein PilF